MFYSQDWVGQDQFVAGTLKNKTNGTFLDVGCHHYKDISNTYYLETALNWKGIGIDANEEYEQGWKENRSNSKFFLGNALTFDYGQIAEECGLGKYIDYLSIDLEPPRVTLQALQRVLESDLTFGIITFETDSYRDSSTQLPSRDLLMSKGYYLVKPGEQDDFYVSEEIYESKSWEKFV